MYRNFWDHVRSGYLPKSFKFYMIENIWELANFDHILLTDDKRTTELYPIELEGGRYCIGQFKLCNISTLVPKINNSLKICKVPQGLHTISTIHIYGLTILMKTPNS